MSSALWMLSSIKLSATFCAAAAGSAVSRGATASTARVSTARRIRGIERRILCLSCLGDVRGLLWQVQGRMELYSLSKVRKIFTLRAAVADLFLAHLAVQAAQG